MTTKTNVDINRVDNITLSNVYTHNGKFTDLHKKSRPNVLLAIGIYMLFKPVRTTTDELNFILQNSFKDMLNDKETRHAFIDCTGVSKKMFKKILAGDGRITEDFDKNFRTALILDRMKNAPHELKMATSIIEFQCLSKYEKKGIPKVDPSMYTFMIDLETPLKVDEFMTRKGLWGE